MNTEHAGNANAPTKARPIGRASFTLEATLEDVSRVAQALRIFLPVAVPEESKTEIELGVVEAMTNIVKHGYANDHAGIIEVTYDFVDDHVIIELRDHGTPIDEERLFSPTAGILSFDPDDVARLPESGMGIAIIQATFDHIAYQCEGGMNRLRLTKAIGAAMP